MAARLKEIQGDENAKDEAEYLEIGFERGEPVSINGERFDPVALVSQLNEIGGGHGIGRVDLVENRFVGMKSRGVYETPGVTILQAAHRALESITLDREVARLRDSLSVKFAEKVYYGFWFAPEFELMRKMLDEMQQPVNGDVRLKLFRGNVSVVGRRAPAWRAFAVPVRRCGGSLSGLVPCVFWRWPRRLSTRARPIRAS